MGKLHSYKFRGIGEEIKDLTVVDILTTGEKRTRIEAPLSRGKIIRDYLAINSASSGKPKSLYDGWYERGIVNPADGTTFYIDLDRMMVGKAPEPINLFWDADKVSIGDNYIWTGTIADILKEFETAGYRIDTVENLGNPDRKEKRWSWKANANPMQNFKIGDQELQAGYDAQKLIEFYAKVAEVVPDEVIVKPSVDLLGGMAIYSKEYLF